jgi:hypothetical protein
LKEAQFISLDIIFNEAIRIKSNRLNQIFNMNLYKTQNPPGQKEGNKEAFGDDCSSSCSRNSSNQKKNHQDEDESSSLLCTFAATGTTPVFQSIYICHTCSQKNVCSINQDDDQEHQDNPPDIGPNDDEEALPLCICENCAQECHEAFGHDVEYYGSGPSYCDCSSFYSDVRICNPVNDSNASHNGCCVLQDASIKAAEKLGISNTLVNKQGLGVNYNLDEQVWVDWQQDNELCNNRFHNFPFLAQVYTIPFLSQSVYSVAGGDIRDGKETVDHATIVCDVLMDQALELIRHSSDTHWIPISKESISNNETFESKHALCDLEHVAYGIFQRHIRAFGLEDKLGPDGGAEWWVQVKKTSSRCGDLIAEKQKNEAIDLHYDKDEELAETFDLGSFPTLSTVTYLSGGVLENEKGDKVCAAPTVVFPHTYEMPGEGPIGRGDDDADESIAVEENDHKDEQPFKRLDSASPQVLISHPRMGKHLVFDGRLLHGAPSNNLLRKSPDGLDDDEEHCSNRGIRVTFLVNIWLTRRPSKVKVLSTEIRTKIMARNSVHSMPSRHDDFLNLDMIKSDIGHIDVQDGKGTIYERVQLPFVSSGATWIDGNVYVNHNDDGDDENVESGLVVSMVPPPEDYHENTVFVTYDYGDLEPRLEYISGSNASCF